MLEIIIPAQITDLWDEENETFLYTTEAREQTLCLEHSLISLSKWESKWHKPFLSSEKSDEEALDYIRCMTLTPKVDPSIYTRLSQENVEEIKAYINNPMTATTFPDDKTRKRPSRKPITSEEIYGWMVGLNIPVEFERWHLNRLITLIRVCEINNNPPKKKSAKEIMSRNSALNAARRQQLHTKG